MTLVLLTDRSNQDIMIGDVMEGNITQEDIMEGKIVKGDIIEGGIMEGTIMSGDIVKGDIMTLPAPDVSCVWMWMGRSGYFWRIAPIRILAAWGRSRPDMSWTQTRQKL